MKCEIGDIVLVTKFSYPDGKIGDLHYFVIMDIDQDEFRLVNLDYFCFLISSNKDKNNDVNPSYPYNEPIYANEQTGLRYDGHVKCDTYIANIKENDIIMQVGSITIEQYKRFTELYKMSQGIEE